MVHTMAGCARRPGSHSKIEQDKYNKRPFGCKERLRVWEAKELCSEAFNEYNALLATPSPMQKPLEIYRKSSKPLNDIAGEWSRKEKTKLPLEEV